MNDIVDELRFGNQHKEHSYLLRCYKRKIGTWLAAIYNGGMGGVKQMDIQKESNYYDLLLTEETSRYVFEFGAKRNYEKPTEKIWVLFSRSRIV
jgi:hypothetical protein